MLEPELVRGSPTRTRSDRVLAGGLQHGAPAQLVGLPDARRICRGQWLWKRRWPRHLGKRSAFPTFPQPRRRRPYFDLCSGTKKPGSFVMTGPKTGGRSEHLCGRFSTLLVGMIVFAWQFRHSNCTPITSSKSTNSFVSEVITF